MEINIKSIEFICNMIKLKRNKIKLDVICAKILFLKKEERKMEAS